MSTAITWVLVVFVVAAAFGAGALAFRLDAIERVRDGDFTALADVRDGDDLVDGRRRARSWSSTSRCSCS